MFVNAVAYEDGRRLGEVGFDELPAVLDRPDRFVWIALREADADELASVQSHFGLHPLAVEDALHLLQRPKLDEYADTLFVVMHTVELDGDALWLGEIDVFVGRNYVISVRNRTREGFADVRRRCEHEPQLLREGPAFVLYALMDAVVDRYFPVLEVLESELDALEDAVFEGGNHRRSIQQLYALKRKVAVLKHAVAPLLEVARRLHGSRVPELCRGTAAYFRDVYDHLDRIDTGVDAIRDSIATVMQVNLSLVAIEESEVSKRLAAWAAIFAVATVFAGIWGMNFEFMPELDWRYGYPAALLVLGGVCAYLYYRFRRAGWV